MKEFKYDISIIVPVYNNEKYIDQCVESVLNQKFDINRIQLIMIDDGSHDKSFEVMKKYERDNIITITKENSGVSSTRNLGMSMALGKYILFLDSDDYLSHNTCRNLFNLFEKHYDEIDLVTYPIVYDVHGRKVPHVRYDNMYYNGTGVYDLEKDYNLIQATVNVMVKNNFEDNVLFAVDQNFSEDERFDTENLMKKKKIGFCNEATYFYRRHTGTANDTIINPYYSFETITSYYEYLFNKFEENGKVPKYVQALYVNNISWRIRKDVLYPYHLPKKEFDKAYKRVINLMKKLDTEVILSLPYMNIFHQIYVMKLQGKKFDVEIEDNEYKVLCNKELVEESDSVKSTITKFRVKNNKLVVNGFLNCILFEFVKPELYVEVKYKDGSKKKEKLNVFDSNSSYYASDMKTNDIYGYKYDIDLNDVKKIKFYVVVNKEEIPLDFNFGKFASSRIYFKNKRILCHGDCFKVKTKTIIDMTKDCVYDLGYYGVKQPASLVYRVLSRLYIKRKKVWLYSDSNGTIDNAYHQFKHDFNKNDGIERYYVYHGSINKVKDKFNDKEQKALLKFKSLKHKLLFIKCDKVISSFSDLQVYCPYNNGIKWYRDLMKYDFVYLQHGILHANLLKMYAKEFTEISKFVISSSFEKENLTKRYHYEEDDFIECGMPRMGIKTEGAKVQNKILYAPSWRKYLIGDLVNNKRTLKVKQFLNSSYFKENYALLHSKKLHDLLEKNNLVLEFKLHPIFKDYSKYFELDDCKNISLNFDKTVIEEYKVFITDFSSFQFDFVNLKRPIIYFVPDMIEFNAGLHTYRGLDLEYKDAFGNLCLTEKELLKEIEKIVKNKYKMDNVYKKRMDNFFKISKDPCEEIYNVLINE